VEQVQAAASLKKKFFLLRNCVPKSLEHDGGGLKREEKSRNIFPIRLLKKSSEAHSGFQDDDDRRIEE
jgi:hypothetical protein